MMRIILENGRNAIMPSIRKVFHLAAKNLSNSAPKILKLLLEKSRRSKCFRISSQTPVAYTAVNCSDVSPEIMKILLGNGDPNAISEHNVIPVLFCGSEPFRSKAWIDLTPGRIWNRRKVICEHFYNVRVAFDFYCIKIKIQKWCTMQCVLQTTGIPVNAIWF